MQGVVGAAFEGAGVAIGSLLGGAVYKVKVTFTFLVLEISLQNRCLGFIRKRRRFHIEETSMQSWFLRLKLINRLLSTRAYAKHFFIGLRLLCYFMIVLQGGVFMFRAFGLFALVSCLLHVILQLIMRKRGSNFGEGSPFNSSTFLYTHRHRNRVQGSGTSRPFRKV